MLKYKHYKKTLVLKIFVISIVFLSSKNYIFSDLSGIVISLHNLVWEPS